MRLLITAVLVGVNLYLLLAAGRALGAGGLQPLVFAVVVLAAFGQLTYVSLRRVWTPAATDGLAEPE